MSLVEHPVAHVNQLLYVYICLTYVTRIPTIVLVVRFDNFHEIKRLFRNWKTNCTD